MKALKALNDNLHAPTPKFWKYVAVALVLGQSEIVNLVQKLPIANLDTLEWIEWLTSFAIKTATILALVQKSPEINQQSKQDEVAG